MKTAAVIFAIALLTVMILPACADENPTPPELPDPAAATSPSASIPSSSSQENYENWNLEPSNQQAHLIMVARVDNISAVTVVEGAKTDKTFREYRFMPVRILKGLFQRDELAMTDSDLGLPPGEAALDPHLKEGEFRLLILVQQRGSLFGGGVRSFGCVTAAPGVTTFAQRVPLLSEPKDPLVGVVETLIKVADSRSRRERAKLLIDQLAKTDGIAAVPLLTSLQARADWAARNGNGYEVVAPLARSERMAVRSAAVQLLREMLAAGIMGADAGPPDDVAEALRAVLESDETSTALRVAALESFGHLLVLKDETGSWAGDFLKKQISRGQWPPLSVDSDALPPGNLMATTYAERAAAITALSRIAEPQGVAEAKKKSAAIKNLTVREQAMLGGARAIMGALAGLPLDAPPERESVYARAAIRFNRDKAEQFLISRLEQSIIARQSLEAEVTTLAQLRSEKSLPLLLEAARDVHTSAADRLHIAGALGAIQDEQAVPLLADWLRDGSGKLKVNALIALETVDSKAAAQAVRPLLDSEPDLALKLRIARLLARHGIDDGYALATEHLADQTASATLVLIALDDPRTAPALTQVLEANPPGKWRAAALTALAAIGDEEAKQELLEILADDRHPLADEAAQAAGLCADPKLLRPIANLVKSRNERIVLASLTALRRYLSGVRASPRGLGDVRPGGDWPGDVQARPVAKIPDKTRAALAEAVSTLAADPYVNSALRQEALAVAQLLGGDEYAERLSQLADQPELEGERLLEIVQAERRRLHAAGE